MDTSPQESTATVPFMDPVSQKRARDIGARVAALPNDAGWHLLYQGQAELDGLSVKDAADLGRFDQIEAFLAAREAAARSTATP